MKRLFFTSAILAMAPIMAFSAQAQTAPDPDEQQEQTTNSGTLTSSGVDQMTSLQNIYAQESAFKVNTLYLENSSASGIYAEQFTGIGNAGIVRSNVNINNIAVYTGEVNSTTIKQTTHVTGMDIRDSTLELNRVVLY